MEVGALGPYLGRPGTLAQDAEPGGEAELRLLVELLAGEHENDVLQPGALDRRDLGVGQRPGEIDPGDFGADGLVQLFDAQAHRPSRDPFPCGPANNTPAGRVDIDIG